LPDSEHVVSLPLKTFFLALVLAISFVGIFDHSLWTPDEPRVAEIARERAVSGDYLIPHLSQNPFLEHPFFYYAVTGLSYRLFGTFNEGVGRLPSVLFGLGTLLILYVSVRRIYSEKTALLAILMLAGTVEFLAIHHKIIVDSALCFFITASMMSFILAYLEKSKNGFKVFWSALALSFLTKGLVGIAIPGAGVVLFLLWQRDLLVIRRMWIVPGITLVFSAAVLWGLILYLRGGTDFLHIFYIYNQFGRFFSISGYTGGHVKPWYYYFLSILSGGAPWSILFLASIPGLRLRETSDRFMLSWLLGGFILLSLASTKRGIYLLPMYPAMFLLIAHTLGDLTDKAGRWWEQWSLWVTAGAIAAAGMAMPFFYVKYGGKSPLFLFIIFILLLLVSFWWFFRKQTVQSLVILWSLPVIFWSPFVIPLVDKGKSYEKFYEQAGSIIGNNQVIGYGLNETVEAYSPFYGGFYPLNFKDPEHFSQVLRNKKSGLVLVMDGHVSSDDMVYLEQHAEPVLKTEGTYLRDITLWKIGM